MLHRPVKLAPFLGRFAKVLVNRGYLTVALVVMGMILGGWH